MNGPVQRKIYAVIFALLLTSLFSFAHAREPERPGRFEVSEASGGTFTTRSEIDPKYKWNLVDLYATEALWEKDFEWLKQQVPSLKKFEGTLGRSADDLLAAVKFSEQVSKKFSRLRNYATLHSDLDARNQHYQAMKGRIGSLGSKLGAAASFMSPEILTIPWEKLEKFMKENKELAIYRHDLENLFRTKAHSLPKAQEQLLAMAGPVRRVPSKTFGLLNNAELDFPVVKDPAGNDLKITAGKYYAAMYSSDRPFRERVYKGFYQPYMSHKQTFASLLNGNLEGVIFSSRARKYDSTLEAALTPNNVPTSVYDSLVTNVNANLAPLHRWCKLRKRVLGVKEMHPYDTYVTLFPNVEQSYSYDTGRKLTEASLKPLGQDYLDDLKLAFNNRWVDVYETPGKRMGAYSTGPIAGTHPYVLLNWNNKLNDVFTLTHEMGHNMHSYASGKAQPYVYADYPIFVAEVASTANEALLLDYMIAQAGTRQEKMALIEQQINNIRGTFYRQTMFAEFEREMHRRAEAGEPLSPDQLTELATKLYQRYWGPDMVVDKEEGHFWSRIPHLYYNFYVYQYATSYAASQAIVDKIKKDGQPAIDAYLSMLSAGSSRFPIDLLKDAGVDMLSEQPVLAVTKKMDSLLDQLEELIEEEEEEQKKANKK